MDIVTERATRSAATFQYEGGCNPPLLRQLKQRVGSDFVPRWDLEWGGRWILGNRTPGADAIRLDGNDYLCVTGHADIINAQMQAMCRDTDAVVQSGVFLTERHPSRDLERALAQWLGKEDGVVCQSGYTANVGLLQAIADEETPVYLDALAHASLWEGARAARAPVHMFRHNDPEHLDRLMQRHGPGLAIVDSVYSTTGALCPLTAMVEATERKGSMILVDESHSLGTHGPAGAGLCQALGLSHRVHFITASLAKAFAGRAGYFTVPRELRYYVLHKSFPNIFSSSLLPHEIAGLAATLRVIQRSDDARTRLMTSARRLRASLTWAGYPVYHGTEQIIALEAGTESDTSALRDQLEDAGIFGAIFCAPATGKNRAMVRLTLNSGLTEAELARVETVTAELAASLRPWDWPCARRASRGTRAAAAPTEAT